MSQPPSQTPQTPRAGAIFASVAVGGMAGGAARYGLTKLLGPVSAGFPWGTLSANVLGSLLLGLLAGSLAHGEHRYLLPFAATGVLGSFTTFSTFGLETFQLIDPGSPGAALTYAGASLAGGLCAAFAGLRAARAVRTSPSPQAR